MEKNLCALGFMSGTSGDGVDSSVISSNGKDSIHIKYNRFDPYPTKLFKRIHKLKDNTQKKQDILKNHNEIVELEKEITNFHAEIAKIISKKVEFELIGFHGHTIYHNSNEKISKQIGLGDSLSRKTDKTR